jgi:hypothetical protein
MSFKLLLLSCAAVTATGCSAQIEWEYAGTVHRDHGLVSQIGPALGLTSAQIDALFVAASKL